MHYSFLRPYQCVQLYALVVVLSLTNVYRCSDERSESKQENICCVESRRVSETVEQIETKALIAERVVAQLQVTCKNHYDNVGLSLSSSYLLYLLA